MLNYPDCFELSNADTRVTLCHQVGGRVLEYAWQGKNALYLDPQEVKWGTPGGRKRRQVRAASTSGRSKLFRDAKTVVGAVGGRSDRSAGGAPHEPAG